LTGIVTFNGEEEVFVFDRTDQSHSILTHMPNSNSMALVSLVREGTLVPQKATIRVGTDTGTIGYLEAAPQPQGQPAPQPPAGAPAGILPRLPQLPQQPEVAPPPTRRIIRRPMVTPPHP
jgi:hypothetical protein